VNEPNRLHIFQMFHKHVFYEDSPYIEIEGIQEPKL